MHKRVRAVIREENRYLFIHRIKGDKEYWVVPGGGVEEDDATLAAALKRECVEELGVEVEVGEFFAKTYFELDGVEQEQHIFHCRITGGVVGTGQGPEYQPDGGYEGSYEPVWLHKEELRDKHILPEEVKHIIIKDLDEDRP